MKPKRFNFHPKANTSKSWSTLFVDEAKQFCRNTALHGYRFIVLPKRVLLERVFWAFICLASLIFALVLLSMAWMNFRKYPMTSATDSTHYPIWNYEFPAITICSFNKISKKRVFEFTKNLTVTDGRSAEALAWDIRMLYQLLSNDNYEIPAEDSTRLNKLLKDNHKRLDDVLREVSPTCSEMLQRCKWKGEETRCESIFQQIRTSEGFCCSFNYFALKKHNYKSTPAKKIANAPRRVTACGHQTGLEVLVENNLKDYFAADIPSIGYRFIIHNPHHFPDGNTQNILIDAKTVSMLEVTPTLTYSTEHLRHLPVLTRRCLFADERVLESYAQYTHHNCVVECKKNLTIKFCGCVPYKYSHSKDDANLCSFEDIPCLEQYKPLIESSVPGVDLSIVKPDDYFVFENSECFCLPDCEITDYTTEGSSGVLNTLYSTNDLNLFSGLKIENQSVVKIFFSDLFAKRNRWDVVFKWHTLLAYYGGLLGLFVGFSFVSGVEIVYFFVVRLAVEAVKSNKSQARVARKRKRRAKVEVQPMARRILDPSKLIIPSDAEIQKFKMNSNYFN